MKTDNIDYKPEKGDKEVINCWKCKEKHEQVCCIELEDDWTAFKCPKTGVWNEVEVIFDEVDS